MKPPATAKKPSYFRLSNQQARFMLDTLNTIEKSDGKAGFNQNEITQARNYLSHRKYSTHDTSKSQYTTGTVNPRRYPLTKRAPLFSSPKSISAMTVNSLKEQLSKLVGPKTTKPRIYVTHYRPVSVEVTTEQTGEYAVTLTQIKPKTRK